MVSILRHDYTHHFKQEDLYKHVFYSKQLVSFIVNNECMRS